MKKTSLVLAVLLVLTLFVGIIDARGEISKKEIDATFASFERVIKEYDVKLEHDKNGKWYDTVEIFQEKHQEIKTSDGYSKGVLKFFAKDTITVDGKKIDLYYYKGRLTKYNFTNKPDRAYVICK